MLPLHKKHILLTGLIALLLMLAACSTPGQASSSPTPAQTVQNSVKAMSQLNSVHIDLQASLKLASSTSNGGVTYTVAGHGDTATPDQVSMNLSLGQQPVLAVISKDQKVYVQTKNGTWYSVDKSQIKDGAQGFFSQSLATRLGQLMAIAQNAKLTDHGQETVNGVSLDHITATLDAQTLQTLSSQLNGLLPAKAQSGQNKITGATLDLWVDSSTSYVHQAVLDLVTQVDANALQAATGQSTGSASGTLPLEVKAQLNFSKFNQPVNIQAPANAVPLTQ